MQRGMSEPLNPDGRDKPIFLQVEDKDEEDDNMIEETTHFNFKLSLH